MATSVSTNANFKKSFAELMRKTGADTELLVRRVVLDFQTALVMRSPVDTGRFRANWQCGLGQLDTGVDNAPDKEGAQAVSTANAVMRDFKIGQKVFLTNSLPYARRLEYGWSAQQPQGMVRVTVSEYSARLAQQVAQLPERSSSAGSA